VDKNASPDVPPGPLDWANLAMWSRAFIAHVVPFLEEGMRKEAFERRDDVHSWLDAMRDQYAPAYQSLLAREQFAGQAAPGPTHTPYTVADLLECKPKYVLNSTEGKWYEVDSVDQASATVTSKDRWLIPVSVISQFAYAGDEGRDGMPRGWKKAPDAPQAVTSYAGRAAELLNESVSRVDASAADVLAAARGFITLAELEADASPAAGGGCAVSGCAAEATEAKHVGVGKLSVHIAVCERHGQEL
jgi:hypothetical protein